MPRGLSLYARVLPQAPDVNEFLLSSPQVYARLPRGVSMNTGGWHRVWYEPWHLGVVKMLSGAGWSLVAQVLFLVPLNWPLAVDWVVLPRSVLSTVAETEFLARILCPPRASSTQCRPQPCRSNPRSHSSCPDCEADRAVHRQGGRPASPILGLYGRGTLVRAPGGKRKHN